MCMMKNEIRNNPEIDNSGVEQLLKTKISELSESIDCFDKISARAFPKNSEEFTDDEFTVTGLENITGRPQHFKIVKWISVAAAAAVLIAVVPQTNFAKQMLANMGGGSVKKIYQEIINEINDEIKTGDYLTVDMPLDYYINNDVLITPLFSCPFKDCGRENAGVRLYIRQIDGINTTQLYAVEYIGTYSEDNIIAAAESDFKFTQADIKKIKLSDDYYSVKEYSDTAVKQFSGNDGDGLLMNQNGEYISAASFCDFSVIKDNNTVQMVTSEILYGHKINDNLYFYDIISESGENAFNMPDRSNMWRKSVYFNGNSAMPEENISKFTRTELFDISDTTENEHSECAYISPYSSDDDLTWDYDEILSISESYSGKRLSSIMLPNYETMYSGLSTVKMYFSPFLYSEEDGEKSVTLNLNLKDQSNKILKTFSISIADIMDSDMTSEMERMQQLIEEEQWSIQEEEQRHLQEQAYQQSVLDEEQNAAWSRFDYSEDYN